LRTALLLGVSIISSVVYSQNRRCRARRRVRRGSQITQVNESRARAPEVRCDGAGVCAFDGSVGHARLVVVLRESTWTRASRERTNVSAVSFLVGPPPLRRWHYEQVERWHRQETALRDDLGWSDEAKVDGREKLRGGVDVGRSVEDNLADDGEAREEHGGSLLSGRRAASDGRRRDGPRHDGFDEDVDVAELDVEDEDRRVVLEGVRPRGPRLVDELEIPVPREVEERVGSVARRRPADTHSVNNTLISIDRDKSSRSPRAAFNCAGLSSTLTAVHSDLR